jgi:hypothetical protein
MTFGRTFTKSRPRIPVKCFSYVCIRTEKFKCYIQVIKTPQIIHKATVNSVFYSLSYFIGNVENFFVRACIRVGMKKA